MNLDKKILFKYSLLAFIFLILFIFVIVFFQPNSDFENKVLKQNVYIFYKENDYSTSENSLVGDMPVINYNSKEINRINNEIVNIYYDILLKDSAVFKSYYYVYNNVLSLCIETNYFDNSEYGNLNYYSYNINLDDYSVLSDDQFFKLIGISDEDVFNAISNRLHSYYINDDLANSMDFDSYKNYLLDGKSFVYVLKEDSMYAYSNINYTHDLVHSSQFNNIYEFKIFDLR